MKKMKNWRLWQCSTEIQYDVISADIQHIISSMADVNLSLSDPDYTKTYLDHGSSIDIFEGGSEISGENVGQGSSDGQTAFTTAHGTWQSPFVVLYISGTAAANEISYTRLSAYNSDTGGIVFNAGSTVGAGSTLYADYVWAGTGLFRGEMEYVEISSGFNAKNISVTGRDNLLDAVYKTFATGSYQMGWTTVSGEDCGTGVPGTLKFDFVHGSIAEDSLSLQVGSSVAGIVQGTVDISDSRLDNVDFANGTVTFFSGNEISAGSTLLASYRYASGSTVELMVKKICDVVGYSYTGASIPNTGVTAMCDAIGLTAFDTFLKLKEICGSTYLADFWLDPEDELFYFRDTQSAGGTYTRNSIKSPDGNHYIEDATDVYDVVKLYYQGDTRDITKGAGARTLVLHDPNCKYQQEAEEKAKYFYESYTSNRVMGKLIPKDWTTTDKLGDIISITDSATGQSAGSHIIKAIYRHYSVTKRDGKVTYDYGNPELQFADVIPKQPREVSDYRELEFDRSERLAIKDVAAHNTLSGLNAGDYKHLTGTQFGYLTGTTSGYIYLHVHRHQLDDHIYSNDIFAQWDMGDFVFLTPKDYHSGSFEVEMLSTAQQSGSITVEIDYALMQDGSAWDYLGGTFHDYGAGLEINYPWGSILTYHTLDNIGTAANFTGGEVHRMRYYRPSVGPLVSLFGFRLKYTAKGTY